jgi:hypothetical protein
VQITAWARLRIFERKVGNPLHLLLSENWEKERWEPSGSRELFRFRQRAINQCNWHTPIDASRERSAESALQAAELPGCAPLMS